MILLSSALPAFACQLDESVRDAGPFDAPVPPGVVVRARSAAGVGQAVIEVGEGVQVDLEDAGEAEPDDWSAVRTPDDLADGSYRVSFGDDGRGTLVVAADAAAIEPDDVPRILRVSGERGSWSADPCDTGGGTYAHFEIDVDVPAAASPGWIVEVARGNGEVLDWIWLGEDEAEATVTYITAPGLGSACFAARLKDPFGAVVDESPEVCEPMPVACGCAAAGGARGAGVMVMMAMVMARRRGRVG